MLNYHKLVLLIILFNGYVSTYEFSFFNKTAHPLGIAIQFANSEQEPLYKLYIKPKTMKSFVPGSIDIPDIKWSFCLKNIYYIINPTMAQRAHNFAKATHAWKQVQITWIDTKLETTKQFSQRVKPIKDMRRRLVSKKETAAVADRSLCKDRHFEITQDENGNIIISGSSIE